MSRLLAGPRLRKIAVLGTIHHIGHSATKVKPLYLQFESDPRIDATIHIGLVVTMTYLSTQHSGDYIIQDLVWSFIYNVKKKYKHWRS